MPVPVNRQCYHCTRRRRPGKTLCVWCAASQSRYEKRRKRWLYLTPAEKKRKNAANRKHYRKHARRIRKINLTRVLKWQREHPERRRAKDKRYYLKHRTKILRRLKIYYRDVLRYRLGRA